MQELKNAIDQALSKESNQSSIEKWQPIASFRRDSITAEDIDSLLRKAGWYEVYLHGSWDRVDAWEDLQAYLKSAFLDLKEAPKGMLIAGSLGVGKSTLLGLIARFFAKNFTTLPRFVPVGVLFDMYFEREYQKVNELMHSSVLFLDDLARAYVADFPVAKFENFMEYRYANLIPTFISSDVKLEDLRQKPGYERIADRIADPKWIRRMTYAGQSKRK